LVEPTLPLYEKKVRRVFGFLDAFLKCACSLLLFAMFQPLGASRASAQTTGPVTWAVRSHPDSRCVGAPGFLETLVDAIPLVQRASQDTAELVAEVYVARTEAGQHASIVVFDRILQSEAGARELELPATTCTETAEALALVIGVLVEAGRTGLVIAPEQPPPQRPPEPPQKPAREPSKSEAADDDAPQRPKRPKRQRYAWLGPRAGHDLTVQAGMGWGLLPGVYAGGTVAWAIRGTHMPPVWLSVTGWLPNSTRDEYGRFASVYGGLSVCPLAGSHKRLRGQICPSFAVGSLWASSRGLVETKDHRQLVALAGLELKADVRLVGPLALSVTGRAEAPLIRARFVYYRADGGVSQLHQPEPVTLTVVSGLSILFR
jgi:hypothetical protein